MAEDRDEQVEGLLGVLCMILIFCTVLNNNHAEMPMYKAPRYVFRPARPAPALLRRIWAWF